MAGNSVLTRRWGMSGHSYLNKPTNMRKNIHLSWKLLAFSGLDQSMSEMFVKVCYISQKIHVDGQLSPCVALLGHLKEIYCISYFSHMKMAQQRKNAKNYVVGGLFKLLREWINRGRNLSKKLLHATLIKPFRAHCHIVTMNKRKKAFVFVLKISFQRNWK